MNEHDRFMVRFTHDGVKKKIVLIRLFMKTVSGHIERMYENDPSFRSHCRGPCIWAPEGWGACESKRFISAYDGRSGFVVIFCVGKDGERAWRMARAMMGIHNV